MFVFLRMINDHGLLVNRDDYVRMLFCALVFVCMHLYVRVFVCECVCVLVRLSLTISQKKIPNVVTNVFMQQI